MNREERRKAGLKHKEPIINIKVSDIEQIKQDAVAKGCKRAFFLMLSIPTMIIHDKYAQLMKRTDNGKSREERFTDLVIDLYDSYENGYVSLQELRECLEEETGITLKEVV